MKIKLAEALLRRKELNEKVEQLKKINMTGLFDVKVQRKNVTENLDDIIAQVPKITLNEVAAGYDWYAKQLRFIDAAIQQANWVTEIDVAADTMADYKA
jgi:hypothetical protein